MDIAAVPLGLYCIIIPLFGLNGVWEAYVQVRGTNSQIIMETRLMLIWFAIYAIFSSFLLMNGCGTSGLILANGLQMILRLLGHMRVLAFPIDTLRFPSKMTLFLFSLSATVVWSINLHLLQFGQWGTMIAHVLIGAVLFLLCGSQMFVLRDLYDSLDCLTISRT